MPIYQRLFFLLRSNGFLYPTNISSVHLVVDCHNARAGVKIVRKKKNPLEQLRATQILIPSLIVISGIAPLVWL